MNQIKLEAKAWAYLTRRQKDVLLDKIINGGLVSHELER